MPPTDEEGKARAPEVMQELLQAGHQSHTRKALTSIKVTSSVACAPMCPAFRPCVALPLPLCVLPCPYMPCLLPSVRLALSPLSVLPPPVCLAFSPLYLALSPVLPAFLL